MDTQNTPIHIKLWHREFWNLALANLLMTTAVYMLLPVLPLYLLGEGYGRSVVGLCFVAYVAGLYLTGSMVSGLVERHRRNRVYIIAMLALSAIFGAYYFLCPHEPLLAVGSCLLVGASFGLAKMVLCSTLVLDVTESFLRTEANHGSAWFGRLALSLGPLTGYWLYLHFSFRIMMLAALVLGLVAVVLVALVQFPFKAPGDNSRWFSLDRFFLPHAFPLFLNLMVITFVMGIIISVRCSFSFYGGLMGGFFLAILAEKFVFANAELKSETVAGSLCILVALLLMLFRQELSARFTSAILCGFGIGIIGTRFLLFFIKLSHHCERGTSQSTYFLAWETGLALGVGCGYVVGHPRWMLMAAFALTLAALLVYNYVVHPWYMNNKNR